MTHRAPRRTALLAVLCLALPIGGVAVAQTPAGCGLDRPVAFADFDWDSALLLTGLARTVLEEGFGCATEAYPGSTIPMYQGALRGDIDVLMEVSKVNVPDFWPGALDDGRVVELGIVFDDAVQAFYVPRYVVEGDPERGIEALAPDLRGVADLPRYAHLFRDPERPDLGRFHNCILGWQCELINHVKLHVYGLTETYASFEPGTGIALAATMETAYARGEPWLGYYWGPTWLLGKLDMLRLEEPPYSDACWDAMNAHLDRPEQATEACAYPEAAAAVVVGAAFHAAAPAAVLDFLGSVRVPTDTISELLAHMQETGALPYDAARTYLREHTDWEAWVPADVAERVRAALD